MVCFWHKMKGNCACSIRRAAVLRKIQFEVNYEYPVFLTPKSEVAHIYEDDTVRQALDKMECFRYSTIPLLSKDGTYVGTITEGDLLWGIRKEYQMNFKEAENAPVASILRRVDYKPVSVECKMEDLIDRALNQNFVPVVDDRGFFIGMVTRKDIIKYCYSKLEKEN